MHFTESVVHLIAGVERTEGRIKKIERENNYKKNLVRKKGTMTEEAQ